MSAFTLIEDGAPGAGRQGELVVPWWSFTKTLLAAAALRLADHQRISLDTPQPGGAYTLRQLLHNSAGLPDYGRVEAYHRAVARNEEPWSFETIVERAGPPLFPPGEGWSYSNIGYALVGRAIAAATGQSLADALHRLVLEPLGAETAHLATTRRDMAGVADTAGYHPGWVYHGLVVGPVAEAALVLHNLLTGDLLSREALAAMTAGRSLPEHQREPWAEAAYGLGMMTPVLAGGAPVYGHTGGGPTSQIAVYAIRRADAWRTVAFWAADAEGLNVEMEAAARLAP